MSLPHQSWKDWIDGKTQEKIYSSKLLSWINVIIYFDMIIDTTIGISKYLCY